MDVDDGVADVTYDLDAFRTLVVLVTWKMKIMKF